MDFHWDVFEQICTPKRGINRATLEAVMILAVEIAREGREGRRIGTLFVVGDVQETLAHSRALILDPLAGHPDSLKHVTDPNVRETAKELAQLDGAFIVSDEGVVVSACRYIDASAVGIKLPLGLGARHMAGAAITRATNAVAVVVSESAVVRVFDNGELIGEIIPELWMMRRAGVHVPGPHREKRNQEVTVVSKEE